jgi:hypothetical protein
MSLIIKFPFISLEEAVKRRALDCKVDRKFKKIIKHFYEDEVPLGWQPFSDNNTVYYHEAWILGILKTYF